MQEFWKKQRLQKNCKDENNLKRLKNLKKKNQKKKKKGMQSMTKTPVKSEV